jgi:histidinol-phosphatase (PHP family)
MSARLVYEMHAHTPLCRHAEGEPEEYAAVAERRGLAGLVITCHNPMPQSYNHAGRMREDQVDQYVHIVDRARQTYRGRIDVRLGLECDYFPGYEDYVAATIDRLPLHHVLGSLHPQLLPWRDRYDQPDDPLATQRTYFRMLADSAQTGLFDTLAHPDLIKNHPAEGWDADRIFDDVLESLDRIAATGVAMELNTSGLQKQIPEMNPSLRMLREMCRRNIPVVVGADAHVPHRVGDHYDAAYQLLIEAGYTHVSYFLDRTRHQLPITDARASLRPDPQPVRTS